MKRILVTGVTGNLGRAANNLFEGMGTWETVGVSRETGLDLNDWAKVVELVYNQNAFDIVFMTHGTQQKRLIQDFDQDAWNDIVGNNLKSAAILSAALMRYNKINLGGLVVYCSSIQATQPRAGRGLYAIAKSGLEALTRAMAVEMAPGGRAVGLRLGQMAATMKGITFTEQDIKAIKPYTPLPWVEFYDIARLVYDLYHQPSLSGEVIEVSSLHKFSVWPK